MNRYPEKKTFHREATVHWTVRQCAIFFPICKTTVVGRVTFWEQDTKDILLQAPEDGNRISGSLKIRNNFRKEAHLCSVCSPLSIHLQLRAQT